MISNKRRKLYLEFSIWVVFGYLPNIGGYLSYWHYIIYVLDSLVKQYFWSLHNQNYVVCSNGCILSSHAYRQGLQNNSFVFTTPGQMFSFSVFWCSNNWDHPKKDFSNDWQQVFWKAVKKNNPNCHQRTCHSLTWGDHNLTTDLWCSTL